MKTIDEVLADFRAGHHEFENGHLHSFEGADPYELFKQWTKEAVEANENEPNAFVLSTVDKDQQPSSRILYLKDIIDQKLVFYTNYDSQKGDDIANNPKVSMLFFWPESSRQIRVQGSCAMVPESVSDAYFDSRPKASNIGAWASLQSQSLDSRETLENRFKEFETKFEGEELVPRPEYWGGYWIVPDKFEFWQGRPSRLHDRIVFSKEDQKWEIERLNP